MYSVVKSVIASRNYELSDMLTKINTLWVQGVKNGGISDEEKTELIDFARQNAQVQQSIDILAKLEELDQRVKALEEGKSDDSKGETEEGTEATYDEYVAGKWYYTGDIVMFDGKAYKCIAPASAVCTWSPAEYPAYWELYSEDKPLTE